MFSRKSPENLAADLRGYGEEEQDREDTGIHYFVKSCYNYIFWLIAWLL
jgi:hypothetical protein